MPIKLWKGLLVLCVEMTFDTDHVLIRGPTMEQIDQRRLFNFAWYRWSYWNDNSSNATSRKCVGNTTGKDDKQHIKRRMQLNRPLSSRQMKKEKLRHEGLVPVSKGSQAL